MPYRACKHRLGILVKSCMGEHRETRQFLKRVTVKHRAPRRRHALRTKVKHCSWVWRLWPANAL